MGFGKPWQTLSLATVIVAAGTVGRISASLQQPGHSGLSLAGHVQTADQYPIRRARVLISGQVSVEANTDADGNFDARDLPAGSYRVAAVKTGFVQLAPTTINLPAAPAAVAAITMQRGAVITGRVLYESGVPAPDTAVSLQESPNVPFTMITTDDRGVFRFHTLKPGAYILSAPGVYYPNAPDESVAERIQVGVGETIEVQLVMPAAAASGGVPRKPLSPDPMATGTAVVRGRLQDAETRAPIGEARVSAQLNAQGAIRTVETAADGTFTLDRLPAGRYQITATAWGYSTGLYGQRDKTGPWTLVKVGDGEKRDDVTFALAPMKTLAGRVLDEFGEPAPDLKVQAFRTSGSGNGQPLPTSADVRTDDTGAFRVARLEPGSYLLVAYGGELARGERQAASGEFASGFAATFFPGTTSSSAALPVPIEIDKSPQPVTIRMIPARMTGVEGRVTRVDGKPAEAVVLLIPLYDGQVRVPLAVRTQSGADGLFAIPNIPPGTYALQALGMGKIGGDGFRNWVMTIEAAERAHLDLELTPSASIHGHVVADEAIPADVLTKIRLSKAPGDPLRGSSGGLFMPSDVDPDGSFLMEGILGESRLNVSLPDPWTVMRITVHGRELSADLLNAGDGDLNDVLIRIGRGGRLAGRVTDRNGRVLPAFVIAFPDDERVTNLSRYVRITTVDQNGDFELSQLSSGPVRVVAVSGPTDLGPENVKALRARGTVVSIQPGATASVALTVGR